MKIRVVLILGLSLCVMCTIFLGLKTYQRIQYKKAAQSKMLKIHQLPLMTLDSLPYQIKEFDPTILIFFNPTCDHCHQQAASIRDTLDAFHGVNVIWISSNDISTIAQFSKLYQLSGRSGIDFTKIEESKVFETFGSISIPHIFVYNNGLLIQEFKSVTPARKLLHFPNE